MFLCLFVCLIGCSFLSENYVKFTGTALLGRKKNEMENMEITAPNPELIIGALAVRITEALALADDLQDDTLSAYTKRESAQRIAGLLDDAKRMYEAYITRPIHINRCAVDLPENENGNKKHM